ncbi:Photosystem II reaction center protein ycf12 [Thalassoporum mexicanum PCC 7367]|nr:photosystem II reaction center protein Ycf12 [Pseudanabaena sp. PCC 7367]AFY68779.1 Photosystem II reaction center protein ycf12 [Pseudanabaena sp. PCC 7367]
MDFLTDITGIFSAIDFKVIFQLTCLALIVVAGPVVVFILANKGGDM